MLKFYSFIKTVKKQNNILTFDLSYSLYFAAPHEYYTFSYWMDYEHQENGVSWRIWQRPL